MEQQYSNREIDKQNKVIEDKIMDIHEKLDLILDQTTKTNGSVRKLQMWKSYILGLMAGGTIILGLVVFIWNMKIGGIERAIDNVEQKLNNHMMIAKE